MRFAQLRVGIGVLLLVAALGAGIYSWQYGFPSALSLHTPEEEGDVHVRFAMEAYDIIRDNYWQRPTDDDMAQLFKLSLSQAAGIENPVLATSTRAGVATMLAEGFATKPEAERKETLLNTVILALSNLAPHERSGLLSAKQESNFRDEVANIDTEGDLYKELGLEKGANQDQIASAYADLKDELAATTSPDKEEKLERLAYVEDVLTNENTKAVYDQTKAEPTIFSRKFGTHTLYITIGQVAPTTLQEFAVILADASQNSSLTNLIIDMRGNIGGALDFAQYFLGLFIGPNQYAYDLFHQGEYEPTRTPAQIPKIVELEQFKEIAILTDSGTQSTAELTAAAMKRLKLARVVGTQTRGWGTVENTFPIETVIGEGETYSILLVHSLTLRDDQTPIEGAGVTPDVDTKNAGWEKKLPQFFESADLVASVKQALSNPPLKK